MMSTKEGMEGTVVFKVMIHCYYYYYHQRHHYLSKDVKV